MQSQELKQIHALLYEVREHLEKEDAVPSDAFTDYDSQPIRPSHVHQSKDAHMNAIGLILNGIKRTLRSNPAPESDVAIEAPQ